MIIYNLFLLLYKAGISLVSPWNSKAGLWLKGRKDILKKIRNVPGLPFADTIWMHCSSLGEFEQGRPVLETIKKMYPDAGILLTFFSPSGYEIGKNYEGADFICYLPIDSHYNARQFLDAVKPVMVLWVKYDYWFYYLDEIKKRNIPLLLISAVFRSDQPFFKWYGKFYRRMLRCFTHLFVQTAQSKILLESIGFSSNVSVSGDTRFDRVSEIAEQFEHIPLIKDFCKDHRVIVAGSTWDEDEKVLDHFANVSTEIRFIIAPHEIDKAHLHDIKKLFRRSVYYSELESGTAEAPVLQALEGDYSYIDQEKEPSPNVLIIDNIGMLSRLYHYATVTYIGGGFGNDGLHNVLEAAVYGKPVVFGPVYQKSVEAAELIDNGGAFSVENALELEKLLDGLLHSEQELGKASAASKNYVHSKKGAKEQIVDYIVRNGLFGER